MCDFVLGAIVGGVILAIVVMISLAKAAKYADEAESELVTKIAERLDTMHQNGENE